MSSTEDSADSAASLTEFRLLLLVRNAVFNVVRAFSTSAVTVLLPILLVVVLEPGRYAVWALIFSLAAFVAYFDLGLPTSVQAVVGRAVSINDLRAAHRAVRSGLGIIVAVGALCILASVAAALGFRFIFPGVPKDLQGDGRWGLIVLVLGQAATLTGNIVSSYYAGQQRSQVAALILSPGRILSLTCAVIVALVTHNLIGTAVGYAAPLVLATLVLVSRFSSESKHEVGQSDSSDSAATDPRGLLSYSGPLIVWSVCMLVTTGIDLIIVARVDYASIVPYSMAAIVVSAVSGLQSAATGPLLPELARTHSLRGPGSVSRLAERFNLINGTLLFGVTAVLLAGAPLFLPILSHGSTTAKLSHSWPILAVLLIGNAFHLAGTPLSLTFIATRTHSKVIVPPVVEAAVNLALSLVLGKAFGALGVAAGTLIASVVGVCLGYFWSVRMSGVIKTPPLRLLSEGVLRPLTCLVPAVAAALWIVTLGGQTVVGEFISLLVGALASLAIAWVFCLPANIRIQVRLKRRRRVQT